MVPVSFSFVFWENWRHQKDIWKLTDLYTFNENVSAETQIFNEIWFLFRVDTNLSDEIDPVWCFLENVRDHNNPRSGCFSDMTWSSRDGRFWSSVACKGLPPISTEGIDELPVSWSMFLTQCTLGSFWGAYFWSYFLGVIFWAVFLGDIWGNFWVQQGWPFLVIGGLQRAPAYFKRRHWRIAGKLINVFKQDAHWDIFLGRVISWVILGDFWGWFWEQFWGMIFGPAGMAVFGHRWLAKGSRPFQTKALTNCP